MIEFERFSFTYWGQEKPALLDVTLKIEEGEFVLLTGPSGSGKTSLCRCLNGLIPHFHGGVLEGRVLVDGLDPTSLKPCDMALRVGMVFQDPENQLIATDVERDIAFGLENLGCAPEVIEGRVGDVLAMLDITHLRTAPLASLSGGQKQMVALAGALAMRPRILVMDEPTSELDPVSATMLLTTVASLRRELGITVVLVEHRLERVVKYVDRIVLFREGTVAVDGEPRSVLGSSEVVAADIGLPPLSRLGVELRRRGLWQGAMPLDVDEALTAFGPFLRERSVLTPRTERGVEGSVLLSVNDVWFRYEDGPPVLRGVCHDVREGQVLAVMGRNGCGKTTLVKHYNGLLQPMSGTVCVGPDDSRNVPVARLAGTVGLVFQNPNDHLFAETVEEEILFTLLHLGFEADEAQRRLHEALSLFRLTRYRAHYPRSLSGGERQRVALASVVAARPRILVLDEPTRGLEHSLKNDLMGFLRQYAAEGNGVVLVTHDVETVAGNADRVVLLETGRVAGNGSPAAVLGNSDGFCPDICRLAQATLSGADIAQILTVDDLLGVVN